MRLKVITTAFLILGIVLMVGWPWVLGRRPDVDASRAIKADYAVVLFYYFGATLGTWTTTFILAWIVARRTKAEVLKAEEENLRGLIEGTLRDHGSQE